MHISWVTWFTKTALVLSTDTELNAIAFDKPIDLSLDLLLLPLFFLSLRIIILVSRDRFAWNPLTCFWIALLNDIFLNRRAAVVVWWLELKIN